MAMGLEFASPQLLWWLLGVPLVLLFGLWRTRPAAVTVPSLRLWERIRERQPPVRELRRPSLQLSLILQALAAALLVASLAGPQRSEPRPTPRAVYLLVDDSASMGAALAAKDPSRSEDRSTTRMDSAREAVASLLARAAPEDRVVVVAPHASPWRYDGPPSGVAAFLRAAAPAACGEDDVIRSARLLAAEAGTGPGRALVAVTDRQNDALREALRPADGRLLIVGGPARNAGIVAFSVESAPAGGVRVFVRCVGSTKETLDLDLENSADGDRWEPLDPPRLRVALSERGEGSLVVSLPAMPKGEVVRLRRLGDDALADDDTAWLLRAAGPRRIAYYAERPGSVAKALQAVPDVKLDVHPVVPGRAAPAEDAARLVVYDGVAPERLPEGRWVALLNATSVGAFEVGAASADAPDAWRVVAPLTDHVDLPSIAVWRSRPCRFSGPADALQVILGSRAHGPLLAWWDRPGGPVLYAGFDLSWRGETASSDSAWALDPGFAIFWKNVVDAVYSRGALGPDGVWGCEKTWVPMSAGPDGTDPWLDATGQAVIEAGTREDPRRVVRHPGLVRARGGAGGSRLVAAANLRDAVESACASSEPTPLGGVQLPPAPEGRRPRSWAEPCVAAAAACLIAAWLLSRN